MNTQHPDENELVAWLSGEISGDNKTYIEGHLETCSLCQDVVSALQCLSDPSYGESPDQIRIEAVLDTVLAESTTRLTLYVQEGDILLADADWSTVPKITPTSFFEGVRRNANSLAVFEIQIPSLSSTASIQASNGTACIVLLAQNQAIRSVWRIDTKEDRRTEIPLTLGVYALTDLMTGSGYEFAIQMKDGSWQRLCCAVVEDVPGMAGREWTRALRRALAAGRVRAFDAMIGSSDPGDAAVKSLQYMRTLLSGLFSKLWLTIQQQINQRGPGGDRGTAPGTVEQADLSKGTSSAEYARARANAWLLWKSGDAVGARSFMEEALHLADPSVVSRETIEQIREELATMCSPDAAPDLDAPFSVFDALWPEGTVEPS